MQVTLPLDKGVVLLDIAFTDADPNHGKMIGGSVALHWVHSTYSPNHICWPGESCG